MSKELGTAELLGADAVGQPGQRRFCLFVRGRHGTALMWMEKDQLNRLSAYHAAQLITKEWMQPVNETHDLFPVTVTQRKDGVHGVNRPTTPTSSSPVTVYAVRRPDKQWALLAINKDAKRTARLDVQFNLVKAGQQVSFAGDVDVIQFSRKQYLWHDDGLNGHPIRSFPPARVTQKAAQFYDLPPFSLTVLRGKLAD